jgi:hypothetical protein
MVRWFALGSLAVLAAVLGLVLGVFFPLRSDAPTGAPTRVIVTQTIISPSGAPYQSTGP